MVKPNTLRHTQNWTVRLLSALNPVEIDIYLINPKGYPILCKSSDTQKCFKFTDESKSSTFYTDYSETALDHNTTIKIRATLPDDTEGQKITLSGCIWPENRSSDWSEEQLKESFPELFYETTFVQNTPPDNVKNMNTSGSGEFYPGTKMHYLWFDLPNLSLKRNHGSRYEIKTYLRESDGELYYKGSEIISLDDSDMGNHTYLYYSSKQEEYLFYEYTVQVLGPHGLKSEMLSTDPRLGVHQLTEPALDIINEFNELEDEQGFKCIEVAANNDSVSYTAQVANEGDILKVTVDDGDGEYEVFPGADGKYSITGIGQHTITAKSSKDGSRPISVTKKIRIVKTPDPATFTFGTNETDTYFNDMTDTSGYEYLEVPQLNSTVGYTISPTEEGTTVSGTVDGTAFSETEESKTGALNVNAHTLTAVIHKQYCNDVTTTRKIMVAKTLEEPVYIFTPNLNGKKVGEVEYLEVSSSTEKACYTVKPSAVDSGACVSSTAGSIKFDATPQKSGELAVNDYTFTVTVSKDHMIPRTFTKKVKVDSVLTKPEIKFGTDFNNKKDALNYRYIEVDSASSIVTYTVTNKDSRGGTLSTVVTNMANSPNTTVSTNDSGELGVGKYKIEATVKKDGYTDVIAREFIVIVPKLKEPTITFGKDFNGKGADTDGYLYIEVPNLNSTVSYTSSSPDTGVTVTTKINNWAKDNSGDLIIGDHEIVVTVTKAFQIDATITKKVKVVQQLQEPDFEFTKYGLSGCTISGFETIEVPKTTDKENYKIKPKTADSGAKITSSSGSSIVFSETSEKSGQLGIGEYTIKGTVSKDYMISREFTKKIKVVLAIQEPSYSFTPGLTRESGEKWIEVPETDHNVSCTIRASASGEKIKVTEGGTTHYNTGSSPATFTLSSLGEHTLTISITKDNYKTKTVTKTIKIVEQLQKPTFKIYRDSGMTSEVSATNDCKGGSSYLLYSNYNTELTPYGTIALYYKFTSPDGGTVKTTDVTASGHTYTDYDGADSFIELGPHRVTTEVSKTNYVTRTFPEEKIYVQGILTPATFSITNGVKKGGAGTSKSNPEKWQFSYKNYESLECKVSAGNEGNTVSIRVNNLDPENMTFGLSPDNTYTIEIEQTRMYCKSSDKITKYINVMIKPITLTSSNLYIEIDGFGENSFNAKGVISIAGPTKTTAIWDHMNNQYAVTQNNWCTPGGSISTWTDTFTSPTQTIKVCFNKFRRHRGGITKDNPVFVDGEYWFPEIQLSEIKRGRGEDQTAGSNWTYICKQVNRSGQKARPKITFTASE
ncbi:MAG: hypothetical protein J5857_04700 [Treponema sp.]|nr:hypothetical protein [Treponema sp.]